MKGTLIIVSICALAFFAIMHAGAYILHHETKISDDEILIGRVGMNPFNFSEYAVNLDTGEEEIYQFKFFGNSRFIDYERDCQCITSVHVIDDYTAYLQSDGQVRYTSGRTVDKVVPYDQVSHLFEDALATRNEFRNKYADILSR